MDIIDRIIDICVGGERNFTKNGIIENEAIWRPNIYILQSQREHIIIIIPNENMTNNLTNYPSPYTTCVE